LKPARRRISSFALALVALAACTAPPARRAITTRNAPAPIGPYSQAIQVGSTLYVAGQIGADPTSGSMVAGGIQAETRQVMRNLTAVLSEAGFSLGDVVQATVYLADLAEFGAMNEVYGEFFSAAKPARATVGVAELPRGARVEIALVAVRAR
jgi:2-iminobutanoate/2-iminopropanoate deaminase